jgi:hypothetical protein
MERITGVPIEKIEPWSPVVEKVDEERKYVIISDTEKAALQKLSDDIFENKLTSDEIEAVGKYTGVQYKPINEILLGIRPPDEYIDELINNIDSAMNKFNLDTDLIVFRGAKAEHYKDWNVGDVQSFNAFLSTSVTEEEAQKFFNAVRFFDTPIMLEIKVPKKTSCLYLGENSSAPTEDELLLGRGLKYKILERTGNILKVEVVP